MTPIYHSKSFRQTQILDPTERRRHVSHVATEEGIKAAIVTSLFWMPPSVYLMFGTSPLSQRIQQRFHNGSVRAGFVMLPMLFAFLYESSEVAIVLGGHKHGSPLDPTAKAEPSRLPMYQRGANLVLDHPMRLLVLLGIPTVLTSFHLRQMEPSLTLSQRLMHTRVIAQFQIYVAMMGLMGVYRYMDYHGRFEDQSPKGS
ncbi:hypothetical protein BASA81_005900 [Batrachochytrium salamandrivorans]|nr:hypothetical protein BASA81_005900 [Batrachochytrium salamandrivorans]